MTFLQMLVFKGCYMMVWTASWSMARWSFLGGGRLSLFSDYSTEWRRQILSQKATPCLITKDPTGVINDRVSMGLVQLSVNACLVPSAELKTYCCCTHYTYILIHSEPWQQLKNTSILQTRNCGHLFCLVISEFLGTQATFPLRFPPTKTKNI